MRWRWENTLTYKERIILELEVAYLKCFILPKERRVGDESCLIMNYYYYLFSYYLNVAKKTIIVIIIAIN